MSYQCNYCHKEFKREQFYNKHSCSTMLRYQEKDDPGSRLGFYAFLNFYNTTGKTKTFDEFIKSPYYKAFVNFGKYCVDVKVLNTEKFIEWLLKHNKRIDFWCKDTLYNEYLVDYIRKESVENGLSRSIEYSLEWQDSTGYVAKDMIRFGNINVILRAITNGKISPWALYNCDSGRSFLSSLNSNQLGLIWEYIFPDYWNRKFAESLEDQKYAKNILKQAGW